MPGQDNLRVSPKLGHVPIKQGLGGGGGGDLLTPRPEGGGRALRAGRFNRGETDGRKEVG